MKKVVLKLDLHNDKEKQRAMKAVSSLSGIDSISMDMKEKKLTVTGEVDPVDIVGKLRKNWHTEILSVGPAKEAEKKKEDPKKDEPKKDGDKKNPNEQAAEILKYYYSHAPPLYYVRSVEEDPNACVIC